MDVVLIPCYKRPEMLHHCLKHIQNARGSENLYYIFKVDCGFDPEILAVISSFRYRHEVKLEPENDYDLGKLSNNIINGYLYAIEKADQYVFMIETDVMISNDFFKWHYYIQYKQECYASIGSDNKNTKFELTNDHRNYYFGAKDDYQSLGVCFKKERLADLLPHNTAKYYMRPFRYIQSKFPNSRFGKTWVEQAGLIRRIVEQSQLNCVFPDVPRCYHAGFYGKNRGNRMKMTGTLSDKIEQVGRVIYDDSNMQMMAEKPSFYEDSKPVNLTLPDWNKLYLRPI